MRFRDQTALITGGTSGIGAATARRFAAEGASVAITGRSAERGRTVASEIAAHGGRAVYLESDVRRGPDCRRAVDDTVAAFAGIDILFNNAGVLHPGSVVEIDEARWDETIESSVKGTFLMSKYAIPHLAERGRGIIINMSSGWGLTGGAAAAAYCAAKAAIVNLTRAMAIDHAASGIRVNCVCPGDVDTPMLPDEAAKRGVEWKAFAASAADRPLGRIGAPDEIAKVVLFLASEDSSFMTGAHVVVDGGGIAG